MSHLKRVPEAAAPQTTPKTNGGQVTGFVSWRRIFHLFCSTKFTQSTLPFAQPCNPSLQLFPRTTTFKITKTIYHRKPAKIPKSRQGPQNLPRRTYDLPYCNNLLGCLFITMNSSRAYLFKLINLLYLPSLNFDSLGSTFRRL
jgi:hypothetical protein